MKIIGSSRETNMLRIYGWKRSRVVRCMWVMEELGLQYEQIPLNPNEGQTRTPDYLALNPQGKIPTLVHDDFVLTETMAINAYLASSFPGSLWPATPRGAAKLQQWTSWGLSELEPPLLAIMREGRRPKEQIDQTRIDGWHADVHRVVDAVLEPILGRQQYLLADSGFSANRSYNALLQLRNSSSCPSSPRKNSECRNRIDEAGAADPANQGRSMTRRQASREKQRFIHWSVFG